jgi:hypothetical protein
LNLIFIFFIFRKYPRHRKLISINKRNTGTKNEEFNMRHDWNSLLTDGKSQNESLRFTSYSNEIFPNASLLAKYIEDFSKHYNLNVQKDTDLSNINCIDSLDDSKCEHEESSKKFYYERFNKNQKYCSKWSLNDQYGRKYVCKLVYRLFQRNPRFNSFFFRILIVATGMWTPNSPENLKLAEGYEDVSVDPNDYEGKSVLILGRIK